EDIQRALQDGSRVLVAGEPCWPWRDVEDVMLQARQANIQCAIANPDRFLPSRQLIKQQIPGKLGALGLIRMHRWEPAGNDVEPLGFPAPLIRDIDLALWLAGQPPNRVYALATSAGRCV